MSDLIYREDAIDVHCGLCADQFICCPVSNGNICPDVEVFNLIPSAQPTQTNADSTQINVLDCVDRQDDRVNKIAELVDGTIDHFDRDDAMDLLYQIKEVLK